MTLKELKAKSGIDSISCKDGIYTARIGFYYQHGRSAEWMRKRVQDSLPEAEIIDAGEKYATFSGGAPLSRQSHWWCKFKMPEKKAGQPSP